MKKAVMDTAARAIGMAGIHDFFARNMGAVADVGVTLVEATKDRVEMTTRLDDQPEDGGFTHPGIAAIMLDNALGCACMSYLGHLGFMATLDLRVEYLEDLPPTGELVVVSRVTRAGNPLMYSEGKAYVGDLLVATASGSFMQDAKSERVQ